MDKLLLHPSTQHQLKALIQGKPHAILISGSSGMGKETIAKTLISNILGKRTAWSEAAVLEISPGESGGISIDEIRRIRDFLSRKTTGEGDIRRIVLVLDAHTMAHEAQNALLKTLEEPPADTMVILTTDDLTSLKHTIRSRSQQLLVLPVDEESAMRFFKEFGYTEESIRTAYYMSGARAGLMSALLAQDSGHELVGAIQEAKNLLNMTAYERLNQVDALSKQKEQTSLLLNGLECVVSSGLHQAAQKANETQTRKFYDLSRLVHDARDKLHKNINPKLVLTRLCLEM
ncbi:MAG TPA: AAA family ATPase [Candidatus Saccharimonadales bacterium]|nr:AAA family ATPase [Candidatus Saccharimonadales bacterium]